MELNTKQDIDAPIAYVYDYLTNFEAHEKRAALAGFDATKGDTGPEQYTWDLEFEWRSKLRRMNLISDNLQKPEKMNLSG